MRGVTVRITPASRYSTVWLSPAVVVVVLVVVVVGVVVAAATCPVVWLVTMGTDVDTLMTAFLFSDVMICGFDTMLTLFSFESALSIAMNWSVPNVNAESPCPKGPRMRTGPPTPTGRNIVDESGATASSATRGPPYWC